MTDAEIKELARQEIAKQLMPNATGLEYDALKCREELQKAKRLYEDTYTGYYMIKAKRGYVTQDVENELNRAQANYERLQNTYIAKYKGIVDALEAGIRIFSDSEMEEMALMMCGSVEDVQKSNEKKRRSKMTKEEREIEDAILTDIARR